MRNLKMLSVALAASLALAACSSGDEAQPAPASETSTVTVDEIMQATWDESSDEDQELICDGMALMPEDMLDVFMEGMTEEGMDDMITRGQAREFFEGKCF